MRILMRSLGLLLAVLLAFDPAAPAFAQVSPFEGEGDSKEAPQQAQGQEQGSPAPVAPGGAEEPAAPADTEAAQSPAPAPAAAPAPAPAAFPVPEQIPLPSSVESVTHETASPLDTRVTVRVKEAPLATFLDSISAQARVNFIIAHGLDKVKVTAFLQNVKVREALQVLLEMEGISYERVGKTATFTIRPRSARGPQNVTRIYTLNYISLINLAGAGVKAISASNATTSGPMGGGGGGGGGGPGGGPTGPGGAGGSNANSAIPFLQVIASVLSATGKVEVEPRTNSLVITDTAEIFPQIEQLISELDKKVPQVMIEAQIVEISVDRVNELGIEWGGARGELATYTGPARLTDFPLTPGGPGAFFPAVGAVPVTGASSPSELNPNFSTKVQGLSGAGQIYGLFSMAQLTAILRALVQKSDARFLGKPKVLALNNQPSIIQIERKAAVGTQTNTTSAGGSTGSSSSGAERFNTGLRLEVTPQVNRDGYITLLVQPSYTDVVASAVSTPSNPSFDPISRGVSTVVRIRNGQTMVLGGLLQNNETKVVRKVPLLGYIPVLGWLFTNQSARSSKTDLVIFITPTIVTD